MWCFACVDWKHPWPVSRLLSARRVNNTCFNFKPPPPEFSVHLHILHHYFDLILLTFLLTNVLQMWDASSVIREIVHSHDRVKQVLKWRATLNFLITIFWDTCRLRALSRLCSSHTYLLLTFSKAWRRVFVESTSVFTSVYHIIYSCCCACWHRLLSANPAFSGDTRGPLFENEYGIQSFSMRCLRWGRHSCTWFWNQ